MSLLGLVLLLLLLLLLGPVLVPKGLIVDFPTISLISPVGVVLVLSVILCGVS